MPKVFILQLPVTDSNSTGLRAPSELANHAKLTSLLAYLKENKFSLGGKPTPGDILDKCLHSSADLHGLYKDQVLIANLQVFLGVLNKSILHGAEQCFCCCYCILDLK